MHARSRTRQAGSTFVIVVVVVAIVALLVIAMISKRAAHPDDPAGQEPDVDRIPTIRIENRGTTERFQPGMPRRAPTPTPPFEVTEDEERRILAEIRALESSSCLRACPDAPACQATQVTIADRPSSTRMMGRLTLICGEVRGDRIVGETMTRSVEIKRLGSRWVVMD